jgi:hypothetical protein
MPRQRLCLMMTAILGAVGCDTDVFGHGCTEVGCSDALQITLQTPDNLWPSGSYNFEFTIDGKRHNCAVEIPGDLPANLGAVEMLRCEPQLDASFSPETHCTEQRTAAAVSQSCTPVRDHWLLEIHAPGTPQTLVVRVDRDQTQIFAHSQTPKYQTTQPNGPGCDPICKQSQVRLTLE